MNNSSRFKPRTNTTLNNDTGQYSQSFPSAASIWYTGSATSFALLTFFVIVPAMLALPLAGVLVDRWDRRRVMMASDSLAALGTLALALLVWSGRLETWHIYAVVVFNSAVSALQMPAFAATVPLLVHATKQILDTWGEDGWELVQVVPGPGGGDQVVAYLKRAK